MKIATSAPVLCSLLAACGEPAPARDFTVQTSFTIAPQEERHECYRVNVDETVFISKISTDPAVGVHHQILGVTDEKAPEGTTECGLALDISKAWIFQTGAGAEEFAMPDGVAFPVTAGKQLLLQMHLYNAGDEPITSTATVHLEGIAEADVVHEAQLVAAGSITLDIPPQQLTTKLAQCTLDADVNIFGVMPHMHFLGANFRTWVDGREDAMLYDAPFVFDGVSFSRLPPVAMAKGTALNVECTYYNNTDTRVTYGEAASDEMCFAMTYYYPAISSQGPLCLN